MDVPALFASHSSESLWSREAWFRGTVPVVSGEPAPFADAAASLPRTEGREPVAVVDLDSLSLRRFTEGVLKAMKVRGRDIWYMTWIETVDDVFDAFNTNAEMVMGPWHSSASDDELRDIIGVSDSFVPTVFVSGGRAVGRRGRAADVRDALDSLESMGFYRICVLDTDGSLDGSWDSLLEDRPSLVPFTGPRTTWAPGSGMRIRPHLF